MTTPKPIYCGQNWLGMKPGEGGRTCGQCQKTIVNFSKKNWVDIDRIQKANNNSVCGMYSSKQLDYWGQEIPNTKTSLLKAGAITGICLSLTGTAFSQDQTVMHSSLIINGKVTDKYTSETVPFAKVLLKNLMDSTTTDFDGNFKIEIKNLPVSAFPETLEVNCLGYLTTQLKFKDLNVLKDHENNIPITGLELCLTPNFAMGIAFYVNKPTLGQKIKWKLKKWFSLKDK